MLQKCLYSVTTSSRLNTCRRVTSGPRCHLCECFISMAMASVADRVCNGSTTLPTSMCSLSTPHHCRSSRTIGITSSTGKHQFLICLHGLCVCNANFCPSFLLSRASIMSLQALDEHVVSDEEIVENLRLHGSFQTFSPQLKLHLYTSHCKVYCVCRLHLYRILFYHSAGD